MIRHTFYSLVFCLIATLIAGARTASAADPAFVGLLALAVEKDVASEIELPEETRLKLVELVTNRENEAVELVLSIKELPAEEKAAKRAAFADESEKLGLKLLNEAQVAKLRQIKVQRAGMASLGEAAVADHVKLTPEQRDQVKKLLEQRSAELARGNERERVVSRAKYER
ncbi:MAG TPA: hypothetical protein PLV92_17085, partial [Pirellulaceae bacterium]|nr:hypothetical protein [Pirellulaceae bacterium]